MQKAIIFFTALVIIALYGFCIEPFQIQINHEYIQNTGLNSALKGKTAVHISDLHIKKNGRLEKKLLKLIDEQKPDFIFLTGDYIKWKKDLKPALTFLSKLNATKGIWAVMGDYDYSFSRQSCMFCHVPENFEKAFHNKVSFLKNSTEYINFSGKKICIAGFDSYCSDSDFSVKKPDQMLPDIPTIVLNHDPLMFDLIDEKKDILLLAGDTHGGQILLPLWIWKILGYEKCARFRSGLYQKGKKQMYVNRGIGTSHIPFRFFAPPELLVLHF